MCMMRSARFGTAQIHTIIYLFIELPIKLDLEYDSLSETISQRIAMTSSCNNEVLLEILGNSNLYVE